MGLINRLMFFFINTDVNSFIEFSRQIARRAYSRLETRYKGTQNWLELGTQKF
jgi:hypothetical protein